MERFETSSFQYVLLHWLTSSQSDAVINSTLRVRILRVITFTYRNMMEGATVSPLFKPEFILLKNNSKRDADDGNMTQHHFDSKIASRQQNRHGKIMRNFEMFANRILNKSSSPKTSVTMIQQIPPCFFSVLSKCSCTKHGLEIENILKIHHHHHQDNNLDHNKFSLISPSWSSLWILSGDDVADYDDQDDYDNGFEASINLIDMTPSFLHSSRREFSLAIIPHVGGNNSEMRDQQLSLMCTLWRNVFEHSCHVGGVCQQLLPTLLFNVDKPWSSTLMQNMPNVIQMMHFEKLEAEEGSERNRWISHVKKLTLLSCNGSISSHFDTAIYSGSGGGRHICGSCDRSSSEVYSTLRHIINPAAPLAEQQLNPDIVHNDDIIAEAQLLPTNNSSGRKRTSSSKAGNSKMKKNSMLTSGAADYDDFPSVASSLNTITSKKRKSQISEMGSFLHGQNLLLDTINQQSSSSIDLENNDDDDVVSTTSYSMDEDVTINRKQSSRRRGVKSKTSIPAAANNADGSGVGLVETRQRQQSSKRKQRFVTANNNNGEGGGVAVISRKLPTPTQQQQQQHRVRQINVSKSYTSEHASINRRDRASSHNINNAAAAEVLVIDGASNDDISGIMTNRNKRRMISPIEKYVDENDVDVERTNNEESDHDDDDDDDSSVFGSEDDAEGNSLPSDDDDDQYESSSAEEEGGEDDDEAAEEEEGYDDDDDNHGEEEEDYGDSEKDVNSNDDDDGGYEDDDNDDEEDEEGIVAGFSKINV